MVKRIFLNEAQFRYILQETYYNPNMISKVIDYIKSFSRKGKLPSSDKSLNDYFKPYLEQAYDWASQKIYEIKSCGFEYFEHLFRTYVIPNFTLNKRNLIYVERSIDIDTSKMDNFNFSSIGECWSWRKFNSNSYCSNYTDVSFESNPYLINIVICGYVHPDSIDWLETIYLNSYDMKNETEIRMNDNAVVEVSYIKIFNKKYKLGGSFLINASSNKYKK